RFLIPLLLPLCVQTGVGAGVVAHWSPKALTAMGTVGLTALSFVIFLAQADGYVPRFIGATRFIAEEVPPYALVNRLPPGSRTYAEGFATPFYVRTPITYHTVWDRS